MTTRRQFPGNLQRLANELADLREAVTNLRERGSRIPVLGADPDPLDPANLWLLADGRLRVRLPDGTVASYTPGAVGSSTSAVALPAETTPASWVTTYTATWTQTYLEDGTPRSTTLAYYGRQPDGQYGLQRTMIGFDQAQVAADLGTGRVVSVELFLHNLEAYLDEVTIHVGAHASATAPALLARTRTEISARPWGSHEAGWQTVSSWIAEALRTGEIRGLTLDQPSGAPQHFGYAGGVGSGQPPPRIRITYVK